MLLLLFVSNIWPCVSSQKVETLRLLNDCSASVFQNIFWLPICGHSLSKSRVPCLMLGAPIFCLESVGQHSWCSLLTAFCSSQPLYQATGGGGVQSLSHVWLCDPVDCSHAPLSMKFSRQEYWSGLPFLPPGCLPDPGIEPTSPAMAGRFFTTEATREDCKKPLVPIVIL